MSIRFYCFYCPASFRQFKELVEHFESQHNKIEIWSPPEAQHNRVEIKPLEEERPRLLTDVKTYGGADSGCEQATEYLGYQSSCLKCPFKKCVLE